MWTSIVNIDSNVKNFAFSESSHYTYDINALTAATFH